MIRPENWKDYEGNDTHIGWAVYQSTLDSQSACNLAAIIGSFRNYLAYNICLESDARKQGTNWVNKHPITILFAEQIGHLAGKAPLNEYYEWAHDHCEKRAKP